MQQELSSLRVEISGLRNEVSGIRTAGAAPNQGPGQTTGTSCPTAQFNPELKGGVSRDLVVSWNPSGCVMFVEAWQDNRQNKAREVLSGKVTIGNLTDGGTGVALLKLYIRGSHGETTDERTIVVE